MSDDEPSLHAARRLRIRLTAWILVLIALAVYLGFIIWTAGAG